MPMASRKRSLLVPLIWIVFAVTLLATVFYATEGVRSVVSIPRDAITDKPIGGILFALVFGSLSLAGLASALTLHSLGAFTMKWDRKNISDIAALGGLAASGVAMWYFPATLVVFVASLLYLLATRID